MGPRKPINTSKPAVHPHPEKETKKGWELPQQPLYQKPVNEKPLPPFIEQNKATMLLIPPVPVADAAPRQNPPFMFPANVPFSNALAAPAAPAVHAVAEYFAPQAIEEAKFEGYCCLCNEPITAGDGSKLNCGHFTHMPCILL